MVLLDRQCIFAANAYCLFSSEIVHVIENYEVENHVTR